MKQLRRRSIAIAVVASAMVTVVGVHPAAASVSSVSGGAFGFQTFVGLFGGPPDRRGPAGSIDCVATTPPNANNFRACTPTVTLPAGGSAPINASDVDGATAQYGPAVIHQSASESVSTQGTTGATGSVASSASVSFPQPQDNQVDPFNADTAASQCTATENGQSGSATFANASLVLATDPDSQEPVKTINLPANPAPNTAYEGSIDHVGDRFRIILNEQLRTPDSITVNAFHMYLLGETAVGEYIVAQSRCGVSATTANGAPVANDDGPFAALQGKPFTLAAPGLLVNDTDPNGNPLTARNSAGQPVPPGGTLCPAGPCAEPIFFPTEHNGTITVNTNGSFTYRADPGFSGTDTFVYVANDPRGQGDPATVTITVEPTAPVDFDSDGDTDRAVFRNGAWYAQGQPPAFLGVAGDIPVPGDYDGDGDSDHAVYRSGTWYTSGQATAFLGLGSDTPVPGDYDGDGDTDRAVFRPSVGAWYIDGQPTVYHGQGADIPVPADYNGDGSTDVAIWRPAVGGWYIVGQGTVFLGLNGDIPVPGRYPNLDGGGNPIPANGNVDPTDKAIWRPSVGGWYVQGQAAVFLGLNGDVPVPGHYDARVANSIDTTDRGIWRPSVGGWYVQNQATVFLGLNGDIPLSLPQAIYRRFF